MNTVNTYAILLCTLFSSLGLYSQAKLQEGFYIDSKGEVVQCILQNDDWKNNPSEITVNINGSNKILKIDEIQGFGINNKLKYEKFEVEIEESSKHIDRLEDTHEIIYNKKVLLLETIIEGEVNLYFYQKGSFYTFFYSINNATPIQLVSKHYYDISGSLRKREIYKQQISNNFMLTPGSKSTTDKLKYKLKEIANYFDKYNKSISSSKTINYNKLRHSGKKFVTLNIKGGIGFSRLSQSYTKVNQVKDTYENGYQLRFGTELEFRTSRNFGKNSFVLEPTIFMLNSLYSLDEEDKSKRKKLNFLSLDLSAALRRYFVINESKAIIGSIGFTFGIPLKTGPFEKNPIPGVNSDLEIKKNFFFELGYLLNEKNSISLRYQTRKTLYGYFARASPARIFDFVYSYKLGI